MMTKKLIFTTTSIALSAALLAGCSPSPYRSAPETVSRDASSEQQARSSKPAEPAAEEKEIPEDLDSAVEQAVTILEDYAEHEGGERSERLKRLIANIESLPDRLEQQEAAARRAAEEAKLAETQVKVDVEAVKRYLLEAKAALKKNEVSQARRELTAVADAVVIERREQEAPLVRASDRLTAAKSMLEQGRPERARPALEEAAGALETYAETAEPGRAAEIAPLIREIRSVTASLEIDPDAVSKIDGWWNRVVSWLG